MSGMDLKARHMATARALLGPLTDRLDWSAEQLAAHRTAGLRALVRVAVARSPWHRERLASFDPDTLTADGIAALPVMTKADLMGSWDGIVTDTRLTLAGVNAHLEAGGGHLLDHYTAVASGGSTGVRGVFVYDWDGFATYWVACFRQLIRAVEADPLTRGRPTSIAWVMAAHPSHVSAAIARTFADPRFVNHRFPPTLPTPDIVVGLNRSAPDVLAAYPSVLPVLVQETAAGRLRVSPRAVLTAGEPLLPEIRAAAEATWGVPLQNVWGASEGGGLAAPCRLGGAHLSEDLHIVEPVDDQGRPVAAGGRAAKVLLTNFSNPALPLIRYELTDEVTVVPDPCPCGAPASCIADIQGRLDDSFDYGGLRVHPHVFRTALTQRSAVVEYRVTQLPRGAAVDACCSGPLDAAELAADLAGSLRRLGLPTPDVTVRQVDQLERLPGTGKLKRFVPLPTATMATAASTARL